MGSDVIALAFAAGLVAALNPCGFAMLPAYLTLVVRDEATGKVSAVGRALTATAAMAVGFVTVFGVFGLLTTSAANTLQRHLPYVTLAIGVTLVALGVWLASGRKVVSPIRNPLVGSTRWAPTTRLGSMFLYGLGYALASLSCTIGPFLAVTGIGATQSTGAASALLAYAGGFTLIVGTLSLAAALASSALVDRLRRIAPHLNRISGALLVVVGAYVGYYGWYELRLSSPVAEPEDPLIAGAARIQGALAGWVYTHGALPWLIALGVMTVAALVWARQAARTRR